MQNLPPPLHNSSLGGPTPYIPIDLNGDIPLNSNGQKLQSSQRGNRQTSSAVDSMDQMKRARVLCSYDATDHTELSLIANEVTSIEIC